MMNKEENVTTTEIPGDLEMVNCTQPNNHSLCSTPVPHYLNISNELPLEYARPMRRGKCIPLQVIDVQTLGFTGKTNV
ncbi:Ornithine carbamoyltransferase [Frankliniella fusca]|uniref:Ornithine carbamoyltransferase n=1 Tax=Frankliniella fusca TaxID=407009 RepID=A0AAE1HB79_9NEOP|nr:Ornithine carbamoyltransferase [Frankliniella fusca]